MIGSALTSLDEFTNLHGSEPWPRTVRWMVSFSVLVSFAVETRSLDRLSELVWLENMSRPFREQDLVVYQKRKHGTHPSPRAHDVRPSPLGDDYDYVVDKYWTVVQVSEDGRLLVRTPRGKVHEIKSTDPCLRRPTWRERVLLFLQHREHLRAVRPPTA